MINGAGSDWKIIKAGVHQCSVLGPLLFLIYINDLVNEIQNCNMNLFADDTYLYTGLWWYEPLSRNSKLSFKQYHKLGQFMEYHI